MTPAGHRVLHLFLQGEAISVEQDISAIHLGPSFSIGALKKDRIDGFFCAEPFKFESILLDWSIHFCTFTRT